MFKDKELSEHVKDSGESGQAKAADQEPGTDPRAGTIVSPDKMKEIFDKMTEIETNPNSRTAREFEQKMMDMEKKKNTNRRSGQIMIKTMRRGRVRNV